MDPRSVDGGAYIALEQRHAEYDVEHRVGNGASTRRSRHEQQLAVTRDDRRRHRAQHALAGRDQVCRRPDVAREVRLTRLLVEVAHLVVEDHAGAADHHAGAEARFERVRVGHRHALRVDDREVRRLLGLGHLSGVHDVSA
jgi:hypothetical protein